jgi:long-subunit acyl-CoA synthetase (AMP-forming)
MTETTCVDTARQREMGNSWNFGAEYEGQACQWRTFRQRAKYHERIYPKANAETFTKDGWMRTGDMCQIDEDGDMFVVYRIKR